MHCQVLLKDVICLERGVGKKNTSICVQPKEPSMHIQAKEDQRYADIHMDFFQIFQKRLEISVGHSVNIWPLVIVVLQTVFNFFCYSLSANLHSVIINSLTCVLIRADHQKDSHLSFSHSCQKMWLIVSNIDVSIPALSGCDSLGRRK